MERHSIGDGPELVTIMVDRCLDPVFLQETCGGAYETDAQTS